MFTKDINEEIAKYANMLKESYVFDDEMKTYADEDMEDEMPDEEMENSVMSDDKINQIRMLALDGIQDYADNVDSEEYDFFKKIWLMCDKVCSSKENSKNDDE